MNAAVLESKYRQNFFTILKNVGGMANDIVVSHNFGGKTIPECLKEGAIVEELVNYVSDEALHLLESMRIKSPESFYHSVNVGLLTHDLAKWTGVEDEAGEGLGFTCGLLHDFGKIRVESAILNKPGELTDMERDVMRQHTRYGYEILCDCGRNDPTGMISKTIRLAALQHHENMDGSGYPNGLIGADIETPYSKLVAICDVWDALTSSRVYRNRIPAGDAIGIMKDQSYKYDPEFLMCFLSHVAEK